MERCVSEALQATPAALGDLLRRCGEQAAHCAEQAVRGGADAAGAARGCGLPQRALWPQIWALLGWYNAVQLAPRPS